MHRKVIQLYIYIYLFFFKSISHWGYMEYWAGFPVLLIYSRSLLVCCCSVTKLCPTLCDPMNCSTPSFPVLHYLLNIAQTHVHWVSDAVQSSHPLSPTSPLALNLSQHQGLFQWVSSSHQGAKVLGLQHQSFQWIFRVDLLQLCKDYYQPIF